tara:strand:+ start:738 stop:1181 length:444 start_codon:yes stop_codon:yes gene_type:complete
MSEPTNKSLYERITASVKKRIPKHSAYRSGQIVKEYKEAGGKYSGKKDDKKGLGRWFKEKWTNQRGGSGYKKKGDIYRPTKRVTKDTPATHKELTPAQKKKAMEQKKKTGRVKKFKKKVYADSGEISPEEKKVAKNKYNYYSKKKVS